MLRWCLCGCCFMSVTYVTSGLLDHLPQLGREISGGVIKNNPNQRMTDTTTPKPKDGRRCPPWEPPPIHPDRIQLVQVAGRRICCWLRAAPLIFSISDSVSTESSVSEPELRLDKPFWEGALGLDDLGMPLLWVWVSLEAPVALGVRIQFVAEVFRWQVQCLRWWWFPTGILIRCPRFLRGWHHPQWTQWGWKLLVIPDQLPRP